MENTNTAMTYKAALKACKKSGTSRATGDALRAMYAGLIQLQHGGAVERYFEFLQGNSVDDKDVADKSRGLLRDRAKAYDALMGIS